MSAGDQQRHQRKLSQVALEFGRRAIASVRIRVPVTESAVLRK